MASKYDAFWLERKNAVAGLIEEAVTRGKSQKLNVSVIKQLGDRGSWYGYVYSRRDIAFKSEMAHADALKNMLNDYHVLDGIHSDLKMTLSEDATLEVRQTKYKLIWDDFELKSVRNAPFRIATKPIRNNSEVKFDWFTKYYRQEVFFNPGLKFIAFLIYLVCDDDTRFSPALMKKTKWFRLAEVGRDKICIPLQKRQLKVHLRTTRKLPGWSIYKSDPRNFVERSAKGDAEIETLLATTIMFLDQDITLVPKSDLELIQSLVDSDRKAIEPKDGIPSGSALEQDDSGTIEVQKSFDLARIEDERKKTLQEIYQRQGQPEFRQSLLEAYGNRCAITGCDAVEALEAAHIVPYLGPKTSLVINGLLLRADIHSLFDRLLLSIDPSIRAVVLSDTLKSSSYSNLDGEPVNLPSRKLKQPSASALEYHYNEFTKANT